MATKQVQNQQRYSFSLSETLESESNRSTHDSGCNITRTCTSSSSAPLTGKKVAKKRSSISSFSGSVSRGKNYLTTPGTGFSSVRTPGSRRIGHLSSSATPREPTCSVLVAIVEGRGMARGEIGLSSINLKSPELTLSQFSDTPTYVKTITKLQMLQPLEEFQKHCFNMLDRKIIMPNTACENGNMTKLFKLIHDQFQNTTLSTVQRKYFNETKGLQCVKQLCVPEYSTVELDVSGKYYCLAAAAALIKYVEFIQNVFYGPHSLKVMFHGSENTTMIDATTAKNLELIQNMRDPASDFTLYGILNHTKTPGGGRLLRANILQPPLDLETITLRQDAVSELTEKEDVFFNLQAVIGRFLDVDHLLSLCIQIPKQESVRTAESKLTNVIYLKHTLELVDPLRQALGECENQLMKAYYKSLDDPRFQLIMTKLDSVISDDTRYQKGTFQMKTQKCFAVKPNINGLLDIARRTYFEKVDDIFDMVNQLSLTFDLPLKTSYSTSRGFYIQLSVGGKSDISPDALPGIFIKVTKAKNTLSFTTTDLIKLNERINQSCQEIYLMANIVITELLNDIRDHVGCLYKLTETIAIVDVLLSFAHACTISEYVRPEFTDTLAIKQGRHPILEKITIDSPVPNNTYASNESNFIIITGPNMSGKSTYLRQIVFLQVMAQIGCFVPAVYASFRICDQIFSRIGSDDDLETNCSTFMSEMKEMNYIIQNASSRSIIIVDELGRGTSPDEGLGLCHAMCEYLLKLKAFTFFVTHFLELTVLDVLYPNVENYCFEVQRSMNYEDGTEKMSFTHVLQKGKTESTHYGLQLAEMSSLPLQVVEKAKEIASYLNQLKKDREKESESKNSSKAVFKMASRLIQTAKNSRLDAVSLRMYLKCLKKQYLKEISIETATVHRKSPVHKF